ncbi:O-antigen ligase family protein [Patescibacteria group bacterium]|nr:O-antigen ligase family protein [Patescibacteria group bacterium]
MFSISPGQKREVLIALIGAGSLLSLYAIYQFFWGFQNILDYLSQAEPYLYAEEFLARKRVFATFLSPDMFAGYLIMILPLAAGLLLELAEKRQFLSLRPRAKSRGNLILCLLAGLSVAFMLIALLLTKSAGAWIGLFVAFLVFSVLLFVYRPPFLRRKVLLGAVITCIVIISILTGIFLIRTEQFFDFSNPQNSIIQRAYFWKAAVKIIKDFPFTGVGPGSFGLIYPKYKSPEAFQTHFAHNSYLQVWAEMGILGFLAWLWLILRSFQVGLRKLKVSKGQGYLTISLLAASSAFLAHNLIDFDFFIPEAAFHWWVIVGFLLNKYTKAPSNSSRLASLKFPFILLITSYS